MGRKRLALVLYGIHLVLLSYFVCDLCTWRDTLRIPNAHSHDTVSGHADAGCSQQHPLDRDNANATFGWYASAMRRYGTSYFATPQGTFVEVTVLTRGWVRNGGYDHSTVAVCMGPVTQFVRQGLPNEYEAERLYGLVSDSRIDE